MKTITDKFTKFMKSQGIKVVDCTPKTMQKKGKSKEFIAGQKAERKAWLKGLRCHSCGAVKELNMLSSVCGKCWKES